MKRITTIVLLLAFGCTREASSPATPPQAPPPADAASLESFESPAGPGAAEPFLFATRDGVLLSWLEPVAKTDRVALRFSRYSEGRWSEARTIVERNDLFVNWADFPSVAEDAKGALYAHWLQKSGDGTYAYDVRMATSKDGGSTWSAPFLLNRDGKQSEHGFVTLAPLPDGGIGATWLDGRNMTAGEHEGHGDAGDMTLRYATVDANGTIANDIELDSRTCECCTTGMAMTANGPVIVYRDRSPDRATDEIRDISFVRQEGTGWSAPKSLRSDGWKINGCPVNGPQVDAIGNDVATAWFTAANGQSRVYLSFMQGEEAIVIDDGNPLGRVDVVLLDAQTALVSWLEQTATGAEIRARHVTRQGALRESMKIADSGTARATGFTRIARVGQEVWFTWTEQGPTGKRVHVSRGRNF